MFGDGFCEGGGFSPRVRVDGCVTVPFVGVGFSFARVLADGLEVPEADAVPVEFALPTPTPALG